MSEKRREIWGVTYPIKLDERKDGCAITGTDPRGRSIYYDDLLIEGDRVGQSASGAPDDVFPPFAMVVRRDGGLWVDLPDEPKGLTDERIEDALAKTEVAPEFCEWYGGSRVTFRIETHIGHYAEVTLGADMTDEHLVARIESCSRDLSSKLERER